MNRKQCLPLLTGFLVCSFSFGANTLTSENAVSGRMIEAAEVICAGTATAIVDVVRSTAQDSAQTTAGTLKTATVQVDHQIKGQCDQHIAVDFIDASDDGIQSRATIPLNRRCLLFLEKDTGRPDHYRLLPGRFRLVLLLGDATPQGIEEKANADRHIAEELLLAATSTNTEIAATALHNLSGVHIEDAADTLRRLKSIVCGEGADLRCAVIEARIRLGDKDAIGEARTALESRRCPSAMRSRIYRAIGKVASVECVPTLSQLLCAEDVGLRRSASYSLRHVAERNGEVIRALGSVIDDTDAEVQYNALMGLIAQGFQVTDGPSYERFIANRDPYLSKWRTWRDADAAAREKNGGEPKDKR